MRIFIFILLVVFVPQFSKAQDTTAVGLRRNTLKIDFASDLIYPKNYNLSYERVVRPNQSFVVTVGYQEFPRVIKLGENVVVIKNDVKNGYKIGGEYRFYLKKENKFSAPRGVYIGPYITKHGFSSDRQITYSGPEGLELAGLKQKFNILNLGIQLGYQFVINDRWSIDLVMIGPSVSNYNLNVKLFGDFEFDPENVQNEILLELIKKFPIIEEFLNEKDLNSSGRLDTWTLGYKYQFLIGYRFGKYKNFKKKKGI